MTIFSLIRQPNYIAVFEIALTYALRRPFSEIWGLLARQIIEG